MWTRLLAYFRLSKRAICEASTGERDYHDYPDSADARDQWPVHGLAYHCGRCGKAFTI